MKKLTFLLVIGVLFYGCVTMERMEEEIAGEEKVVYEAVSLEERLASLEQENEL